jgi:hypothetical protein
MLKYRSKQFKIFIVHTSWLDWLDVATLNIEYTYFVSEYKIYLDEA